MAMAGLPRILAVAAGVAAALVAMAPMPKTSPSELAPEELCSTAWDSQAVICVAEMGAETMMATVRRAPAEVVVVATPPLRFN